MCRAARSRSSGQGWDAASLRCSPHTGERGAAPASVGGVAARATPISSPGTPGSLCSSHSDIPGALPVSGTYGGTGSPRDRAGGAAPSRLDAAACPLCSPCRVPSAVPQPCSIKGCEGLALLVPPAPQQRAAPGGNTPSPTLQTPTCTPRVAERSRLFPPTGEQDCSCHCSEIDLNHSTFSAKVGVGSCTGCC